MTKEKRTYSIITLGCKLNFAESSSLSRRLDEMGYSRISLNKEPDIVLINTCTVTAQAAGKCRQAIGKAKNLSPSAKIIITGCYSELEPQVFNEYPEVIIVTGNKEKSILHKLIDDSFENKTANQNTAAIPDIYPAYSDGNRTRAFIKIQDGCDYHCAYCIIPKARGKSRSLYISDIIKDVRTIAEKGTKEIVLTGINIGDFGLNTGEKLSGLISAIDAIDGISRIRISSVEPDLFTDDLLQAIIDSKKVLPHFHLPLQSASTKVLKLMNRRYTIDLFSSCVEKIIKSIPSACIASDIICGFPGEGELEYEESYNYIKESPLAYIHGFTFSEREGTRAASLSEQVEMQERRRRTRKLQKLSDIKRRGFLEKNIGNKASILFEAGQKNGIMHGLTGNYIKVKTT